MALTALNGKDETIYAPDITDPIQPFRCKHCNEGMTFVNAQQKNKHFRHAPHSTCSNTVLGWEPETKEHEEHKIILLEAIRKIALATPAAKGFLAPEFPVGDCRPDVYWIPDVHGFLFDGIAFEVQASNYDIDTYMKKIGYYAEKNIYAVYLFLVNASPFMAETRSCVFSLKAVERQLIVETNHKPRLYAVHMDGTNIYDYIWREKSAKGTANATNDTLFITSPKPLSRQAVLAHPSHYLGSFLLKILEITSGGCTHDRYHYDHGFQYLPRKCFDCGKILDYRNRNHPSIIGLRTAQIEPRQIYKKNAQPKQTCNQQPTHDNQWNSYSAVSFLPSQQAGQPTYKVVCSNCGHYYQTLPEEQWREMGLPEIKAKKTSDSQAPPRQKTPDQQQKTRPKTVQTPHMSIFSNNCTNTSPRGKEKTAATTIESTMEQLTLPDFPSPQPSYTIRQKPHRPWQKPKKNTRLF